VLPERRLLDAIAPYSPLVEIGAGTGYWAYLLSQFGVDVIAYDVAPLGGDRSNRYHFAIWPWADVHEGDISSLQLHSDRTLLVCWPPLFSSLGDVLRYFQGECVIYVGDHGYRTARLAGLEESFDEVESHDVIAMDPAAGAVPRLSVWKRRAARH
jgi:hypothetical protein